MRTTPHLFEELTLKPRADMETDPPYGGLEDETADWDSDPMVQLMFKQERERNALADQQAYELRMKRREKAGRKLLSLTH